jgi:hypothetical protein
LIFKIFWASIVSFIAALCVEISPNERLLTRAQYSIKMLSALEQALGYVRDQKVRQKETFRGEIVTGFVAVFEILESL